MTRIAKGGPAEAGLDVGDLLLGLNPADQTGVVEQIAKNPPGTKLTLPVQRFSGKFPDHYQELPLMGIERSPVDVVGCNLWQTRARTKWPTKEK